MNLAYFVLNKLLSSRILSWVTKEKMYVTYLRSIVTYDCETWSTTQGDEEKCFIFKRKVLRKIYEPVRNESTREYKKEKKYQF